jgi:predicted metal-dependent enzyme (double-stranded beta helix superfamily)
VTAAPLEKLVADLDAAVSGPDAALAAGVTAALQAAVAAPDWLSSERRRASYDNYARHLIHADPAGRYSILAIVWGPGQMSPVHGHLTWCGVGVYSGTLAETYYRDAGNESPVEIRQVARERGSLSFDRPHTAIHRIANTGEENAISLHVYGVGRDQVTTAINRIYTKI